MSLIWDLQLPAVGTNTANLQSLSMVEQEDFVGVLIERQGEAMRWRG